MVQAGFPEEEIEAARRRADESNYFEVWRDNWRAVTLFARMATQWRVSGMGEIIGLDYAAIEAALRLLCVPRHRRRSLFADFQIMEAAVIDYRREAAEK
jgi:hypothetical protein